MYIRIVFVKEVNVFFFVLYFLQNASFFVCTEQFQRKLRFLHRRYGVTLHVNIIHIRYTISKKLCVAIYEKNLYIFSANSALLYLFFHSYIK